MSHRFRGQSKAGCAPSRTCSKDVFHTYKRPSRLKTTLNGRELLLSHLAAWLHPPQLDLKRKHGFSISLDEWFGGEWDAVMPDVLAPAPAELLNRVAVDDLIQQQTRRGNQPSRLFALMIFELWRRENGIAI